MILRDSTLVLDMDFDDLDGTEEAVRVFVRIRPLNKREIAEKQTIGWNFNDTSMLEDTPNGQRVYAYDHCFGPTATNLETYDIVGKPVVLKAMEGYNGTVFTYGQTGSGKTWTMRGCETDPGMMVLCIRDILEWEKNHPDIQFTLKVAYLEVYNEEINDLLGDQGPNSKNLKIVSEDAARGAVIGNLIEEMAKTADDFMAILRRGEASRSYASTNMNAESSRSHTIYRITVEAKDKSAVAENDDGEGPPGRISYLNLVDLAGSERQKSTKAEGKVLKEGANINKSLLALGAVINKLGESSKKVKGAKPAFIPYRDSKLTRILKQSLGGNTLTSILCAVTPAPMHREETVSTLKFGQLCKSIKNNVKANDGIVDDKTLVKQYRNTINELRAQIEELSAGRYNGGSAAMMMDPDSALGQAMQQKADLEARIRAMETLLLTKGATAAEIATIVSSSSSASSNQKSAETEAEIIKLNEKIAEQQKHIAKLQRTLGEFQDLEESKASFEEYEHHVRQEIDEETAKLEEEKLTLQNERYKLLKDRSGIDEKESRIGLLLTNLDEKESKLRQLIANMKEQQDQWSRSVSDLQKREDLVDDWQRNHKQKEKKLLETEAMQEKKFQELNKRESFILEEENRLKNMNKELSEREQRLQIGLSRVTNQETVNNQKEESLMQQENQLKKKEQECDIRERELLSRRKDLESWDVLLREKDRKVAAVTTQLDEREAAIKVIESKNRTQEMENEKKSNELTKQIAYYEEMMNKYQSLMIENEDLNKELKDKVNEYDTRTKECNTREEELKKWEKQLMKLQDYLKHIESRENKLKIAEQNFIEKENEFYQVKVSQITSRHNHELKSLEEIISKQLKITADFQKELETMKHDMANKMEMIHDLEVTIEQKTQVIDSLKEQLSKVEQGASVNLRNSMLMAANANANANDSNHAAGAGDDKNGSGNPASGGSSNPSGESNHSPNKGSNNNNAQSSASNPFDANKQRGASSNHPNSNVSAMGFANAGERGEMMNLHPHNFIAQLAVTRNILYQVLEKYDALPETNLPSNRRRGMVVEQKKKYRASSEDSRGGEGGGSGRRSRGRSGDSGSGNYEQSSNEELKEGGVGSPPPTNSEQPQTLPHTSTLASLFVSPAPPNPNGIAHAASVRSIGSLLSDNNGNLKARKQAILTPGEAPPVNTNTNPGAPGSGNGKKENTRASVTTLLNELSLDFKQKVGSSQRLGVNSSSQYPLGSIEEGNGRSMPRQSSYQSMASTIGSPTGPTSPHQNAGIVGMKPAPVTPNTLNAANQRSSPLRQSHLNSSPSAHNASSTGKKAPRSSANPAAAVFGEELSSIVRMGDYDESGVPVTTVNLGLKSKRIVKQLTHPHSFNAGYNSQMKFN